MNNFSSACIKNRKAVVLIIAIITACLSVFAFRIDVKTIFEDLQPSSHEYIKVHEQFKNSFGGTNIISFMISVEDGDIFDLEVLGKIQKLTQGLVTIDAINQFQIYSIAGNKLKEVKASTEGIESKPYMYPNLPKNNQEVESLKQAILNNPLIYGPYVSKDMKATLVTVDFYDDLLNYNLAYQQAYDLGRSIENDRVGVSIVGNPVLYGWVNHYLPETVKLIGFAVVIFLGLLFIINRTWRGTLLPVLSGVVSAIWALGISRLLGINFDPLVVVIAMLITARAVSHSVQMVTRFHEEIDKAGEATCAITASKSTLKDLLRPGLLGIATDAGCVAVVAISPIPLLQKLVVLAVVWVSTVAVSSVILTPVLLSWIKKPNSYAHKLNLDLLIIRPILRFCVKIVETRARFFVVGVAGIIFVISGFYSLDLKVGDANPGSPILWPNSEYNIDSKNINDKFSGADRMFVVVGGERKDQIKETKVLETMLSFQAHMEAQEEIGGTLSIADILPEVNKTIREGNSRYAELGEDNLVNGELMYMFENASEPGDLDRFVDVDRKYASITLFFTDRQGETIRTAIARVNSFIDENSMLNSAKIHLAGGIIGVIAAVNEVILSSQIQSIALALLILVIMCMVVYKSSVAGMFFMVPVILSNLVTFAFMAWQGIGMNINTVPVAALGIGLGVDYALYICDRIKSEYENGLSYLEAISLSLHCAGRGVLVTAIVLIASVFVWFESSLRFQAEMGLLIAIWLTVSALSALLLMPSMAYIFKPKFIFGSDRPN